MQTVTATYNQGGPALPDSSDAQQLNVIELTRAQASLTGSNFTAGQTITLRGAAGRRFVGDPTPQGGSIEFFVDGQSVGTAPADAGGKATLDVATIPAGSHQLTVQYLGVSTPTPQVSSAASAVSSAVNFTVSQPFGTLVVSPSVNPAPAGQPLTFTATFAPPAGGATPTGTVRFAIDNTVVTVPLNGTTATYTAPGLTVGDHRVSAVYSGDVTYVPEVSNSFTEHVLASTTTTVTLSPAPAVVGQSVTLTVTVTGQATVANQTVTPTGTVDLFVDGIGPVVTLPLSGGQASLTVTDPQAGTFQFQAVYSGDSVFLPSTSATTPLQSLEPAQVALTPGTTQAFAGQPVTLTVAVAGADNTLPAASGTVVLRDGGTPLLSIPLQGGTAVFTLPSLPPGPHDFTASYPGDTTYTPAVSGDVTQTVAADPTTTVLVVSPSAPVAGQPVTLTATVTNTVAGGTPPAGLVDLFVDGPPTGTPAQTVTSSGGSASFSLALPADRHVLDAVYRGVAADAASDSGPLTLTVGQIATQTTLGVAPGAASFGQPVTLTATVQAVAPGGGTPAGSVTFLADGIQVGSVPLDGAGQASLQTTALALGTDGLMAVYGAAGDFSGSTSTAVSVTVSPAVTPAGVQDVSTRVRITPVKRRPANRQRQTFLVQNTSGTGIDGPVYLVLDRLTRGVRLANASRLSQTHLSPGDPVLLVTRDGLGAGQRVTVNLSFAPAAGKRKLPAPRFALFVLAGPGVV